jgi:hypothetical protein
MHRTHEKGTKVSPTERSASKTPPPPTGIFAALPHAFLPAPGSSAPSTFLAAALLFVSALALLAPSAASAAFTRPFRYQIAGVPGRLFTSSTATEAFHGPEGLAIDAKDDLWLASLRREQDHLAPPFPLDAFSSSGAYLETLGIATPEASVTSPESLAINRSTGSFYVTGDSHFDKASKTLFSTGFVEVFDKAGAFVKRFGAFSKPSVAVDNSAEPSAGSVYVLHGEKILNHRTETGSRLASRSSMPPANPKTSAAPPPISPPTRSPVSLVKVSLVIGHCLG